jgi:predicted enzyme related to lactoylglutathione lyase
VILNIRLAMLAMLCTACRLEQVEPLVVDSSLIVTDSARRLPVTAGHFLGLRTAKYSARDLAAAKAWYIDATGVTPYFDEPFYVGFNIGGFELGITPADSAAPTRDEAGIAYWGVTDAHAAWQRLVDLGATPHEPIQDVGEGILIGSLHDPFGNIFGIIENPHFGK